MHKLFICALAIGCGSSHSPPDAAIPMPDLTAVDDGGQIVNSLTFPDTAVGQSGALTVHVTNQGDGATGPLAISITGAAANDFIVDNSRTTCAGLSLAPLATCDIALRFEPAANGDRTSQLGVASTPGGSLTIDLLGHAFTADLVFIPPATSFGTLEIGTSLQTTIQLANEGTNDAPIDSIKIDDSAFVLGINTCGASLPAGGGCEIAVTYHANDILQHTGTLTVVSNGVSYTSQLTGRGAMRVTVILAGNGTGTVTSSPP